METILVEQFDFRWDRAFLYYLILPFYGPGNWFIPIIFQAMILLPLLYWIYKKAPRIVLFLSVIWEIGFQYFMFKKYHWSIYYFTGGAPLVSNFLRTSLLFYMGGLFIGFWLADHFLICTVPENKNIIPVDTETEFVNKELVSQDPETENTKSFISKFLMKIKAFFNTFYEKLPWHFYLVLLGIILCSTIWLLPFLDARISQDGVPMMIILFLIIFTIGIYTYRPIGEFLVMVVLLSIFTTLFVYVSLEYTNSYGIEYIPPETLVLNHSLSLFFIAMIIFILPYFLNLFIPLLKRSKFGEKFPYPQNKNWFLWLLFLMSGAYQCLYLYTDTRFGPIGGDYNLLVFPHSILIILVFIRMIPIEVNNVFQKILKGFSYVGKATYHILLTQMFVYGIMIAKYNNHYMELRNEIHFLGFDIFGSMSYNKFLWLYVGIMWLICIPIGLTWYFLEKSFWKWINQKKDTRQKIQPKFFPRSEQNS
jgi:hypothetical protein